MTDLVAARVVFLKAVHEIKLLISDILRITINSILLYNFPRKSYKHSHLTNIHGCHVGINGGKKLRRQR
jgi:hypothetical protein